MIVWTNTSGGNWNAAANWSPNQVPGSANDDAVITNNGTYTVVMNVSPVLNSLTLGGGAGVQTLVKRYDLYLYSASVINPNGVLDLSGGYWFGPLLTVSGTVSWTGGYIASGSMLAVATNGVLELAGVNGTDYRLYGGVTNAGTVRLVSGNLQLYSGCSSVLPQLVNLPGGWVDLQADVSINRACGSYEVLENLGTVLKSGGTGTSTIGVVLHNSGRVQVRSGTLSLTGGGRGSGEFLADTAAAVVFGGGRTYQADPGTVFLGAGTNLLSGGTLTVTGEASSSNLMLKSGQLIVNGCLEGTGTVLAGASLAGRGSLGGVLTWASGMITNDSTLTVATNGVLVLAGVEGTDYALRGVLTNAGTVQLVSGNLQLYSGGNAGYGQLINLPGGVLDLRADVAIGRDRGGYDLLDNLGTVRKSGGAGTSPIHVAFHHAGLLEVQTGALYFTSAFAEAGGAFAVRINDATSWGQLLFSNAPALGGPFTVTVSPGYVPSAGDRFRVLGFPASSGGFTAYHGLDLGEGWKLAPRFNPADFSLEVSAPPVDNPSLSLYRLRDHLLLWWPTSCSNSVVFSATNLAAPTWTPEPLTGPNQVLLSPNQPRQYFRLGTKQ